MDKSKKDMDKQELEIEKLVEDINPNQDVTPDSLAEATTVPLDDDALGGNATEDDIKKNTNK
ncbi:MULTISPECIES: hypothetical protein [unclassified Psychrobacter]|uniref:hypothetical protein n=1 Tax=unclassified Psychrobacter TaxID=196806 RepID=UPI00078C7A38|nr:hypothetical protein [Psychrobacter sp. P2G3]AMN48556.1 hypothetical protein AK823_00430 [Psychrobacter sp. P2G3]